VLIKNISDLASSVKAVEKRWEPRESGRGRRKKRMTRFMNLGNCGTNGWRYEFKVLEVLTLIHVNTNNTLFARQSKDG